MAIVQFTVEYTERDLRRQPPQLTDDKTEAQISWVLPNVTKVVTYNWKPIPDPHTLNPVNFSTMPSYKWIIPIFFLIDEKLGIEISSY